MVVRSTDAFSPLWATPQQLPKAKDLVSSAAACNSESQQRTSYDAISTTISKHESLQPTGRGKLRFDMRRQKLKATKGSSIYNAVFTKQQHTKEIPTKHSYLYNTLNAKSSSSSARLYQQCITIVILFDALIYILSTEPSLAHYHTFFYSIEAITSTIFAVEYVARLLVCTEKKCYAKFNPIRGRWKYMCSSQALLDAFATL